MIKEQRERILSQNEIIEDQQDIARNLRTQIKDKQEYIDAVDETNSALEGQVERVGKRLEFAYKKLADAASVLARAVKRLELAEKKLADLQGDSKGD